uniref:Uncharacterized protein n=1 Tax=Timema tahoe TaxID=61484 RepID=A0A7R9P1X3_9NEOP|nr:unnamed protein product [Timema tahoe]
MYLSNIISMSVSGVLSGISWDLVFYVYGGCAILWSIPWLFLIYSSPEEHPTISPEELLYITKSSDSEKGHDDLNKDLATFQVKPSGRFQGTITSMHSSRITSRGTYFRQGGKASCLIRVRADTTRFSTSQAHELSTPTRQPSLSLELVLCQVIDHMKSGRWKDAVNMPSGDYQDVNHMLAVFCAISQPHVVRTLVKRRPHIRVASCDAASQHYFDSNDGVHTGRDVWHKVVVIVVSKLVTRVFAKRGGDATSQRSVRTYEDIEQ